MHGIYVKYLAFFVVGFIVGMAYILLLYNIYGNAARRNTIASSVKCSIRDYRTILHELKRDRYTVYRVVDFIKDYRAGRLPREKVIVILRHDVDFIPSRAINMSREEHRLGVSSTYYVRVRGAYNILDPKISKWIVWLKRNGFEVGLHYEELYYCNYNFTCAKELFTIDLALLRSLAPVYTVCSHGNKVGQVYVNYELFKMYPHLMNESKLYGEAYLTIREIVQDLREEGTIKYYKYMSDTTGCDKKWLEALREARPGSIIYLLIHPDNWNIGS